MSNQPKTPDALPSHKDIDPNAGRHAEHGVPPGTAEDEPKGTPNSDRHHKETVPAKC